MYVNTDISRTMDGEQRAVYTSERTLSRTLTLSLSLLSPETYPLTDSSNISQGYLGAQEREGVHETLKEMELQHAVDLSSWKLAETWHGSSLPRGLSRGLDDISHSHPLNVLLNGMGE